PIRSDLHGPRLERTGFAAPCLRVRAGHQSAAHATGRACAPAGMRGDGGTMKRDFVTVDVFTDRRFGGNPLAVVPDARGLTPAQMQAIATEFNLSETTFVLPPMDAGNTAHVRIFTPRAELLFAGHPNVGTAFVLATATANAGRPIAGDTMTFEE